MLKIRPLIDIFIRLWSSDEYRVLSMLYITGPELSDEILREISIARAQRQRGETFSLREVKDQLGL